MIPNHNPVTQALLGTLFTWGVTALGAALVFVFRSGQVRQIRVDVILCALYFKAYTTVFLTFFSNLFREKFLMPAWGLPLG